jgi:2-polyprenyl-3-methyl-5-hydroxy-6-metoxy-1,4-benzoquinol methylase
VPDRRNRSSRAGKGASIHKPHGDVEQERDLTYADDAARGPACAAAFMIEPGPGAANRAEYLQPAYARKSAAYFSGARADYVRELAASQHAAILEIGCGTGATGALALREGKCGTYVGVEMFEPAARQAAQTLSRVHTGNVEQMDLPYPPDSFDALICSEVLEHLVDPESLLVRLLPLLRPGARVFASSPNAAHWQIIVRLARGRFEYEDSGPMDRTHLRWFTPHSYRALFERAGFVVDRVAPLADFRGWRRLLRALGGERLAHLSGVQIDLRAHVPQRTSQ